MKRINIILSDELAAQVERLSRRKELSVAEITRRSLEIYIQRFPDSPQESTALPVFDFGRVRKRDVKRAVYEKRIKEILD
ncbi:MAG TPA: hypothetical protein VI958_00635 [Acidobacteriota bacterium]